MKEIYSTSNTPSVSEDYPDYPIASYYTPTCSIGGFGGKKFLSCGGIDGRMVTKLECWYGRSNLVGICLTYSDGSTSGVFGKARQNYAVLKLSPGELITSLLIWENDEAGVRAGRIELETSMGQAFAAGKKYDDAQQGYSAPVGSGHLVGITGRSGDEIDMLGFIFFAEIEHVLLDHVTYKGAPSYGSTQEIRPSALEAMIFCASDTEAEWEFQNSTTQTMYHSFSQAPIMLFFAEVKVNADLFDLGYYAAEGWKPAIETEPGIKMTEEIKFKWDQTGRLKAGQTLFAVANTTVGKLNIPYSGTLTITLKNGRWFNFKVKGIYSNMVFGPVYTSLTFDPPNEL